MEVIYALAAFVNIVILKLIYLAAFNVFKLYLKS